MIALSNKLIKNQVQNLQQMSINCEELGMETATPLKQCSGRINLREIRKFLYHSTKKPDNPISDSLYKRTDFSQQFHQQSEAHIIELGRGRKKQKIKKFTTEVWDYKMNDTLSDEIEDQENGRISSQQEMKEVHNKLQKWPGIQQRTLRAQKPSAKYISLRNPSCSSNKAKMGKTPVQTTKFYIDKPKEAERPSIKSEWGRNPFRSIKIDLESPTNYDVYLLNREKSRSRSKVKQTSISRQGSSKTFLKAQEKSNASNKKLHKRFEKVMELDFIREHLSNLEFEGMCNELSMAGVPEARWPLFIIDRVYQMIKTEQYRRGKAQITRNY